MRVYSDFDDIKLIELAKSGDEGAYTELFMRYDVLCKAEARKVFFYLPDIEEAEQQCRIGLYKAIKSFDGERGTVGSYFKSCVHNAALDALRCRNIYQAIPLDFTDDSNADIIDPTDGELGGIYNGAVTEAVEKYFEDKPQEKTVFSLYNSGYSYKDIAAKTGLTEKQVDNRLQKIKSQLKIILSDVI